jgi:hypothetical protein
VDTWQDVDGEEIFEEPCRRSPVDTGPDDARCVSESGRETARPGTNPSGEEHSRADTRSTCVETHGDETGWRWERPSDPTDARLEGTST